MLKKHPLISVVIAIVVIFFAVYFFIFGLATILDDDIGDSKELNNSYFYVKDDKVYALVPSGGKFELIGVRPVNLDTLTPANTTTEMLALAIRRCIAVTL